MWELQERKLEKIKKLLSQNLRYISGPRESGPNGAKADFLRTGKAFLKQLAEDLKFTAFKVSTNPAGIACSGEVILNGMWNENEGITVRLSQDFCGPNVVLFRTIKSLNDFTGGINHFMTFSEFKTAGYPRFMRKVSSIYHAEGSDRLDDRTAA